MNTPNPAAPAIAPQLYVFMYYFPDAGMERFYTSLPPCLATCSSWVFDKAAVAF